MIDLNIAVLDGVILSTIMDYKDGTYGYEICNKINCKLKIPEVTIYKILKRLNNMQFIESRNEVVNGRNRKIYTINSEGVSKLNLIRCEWSLLSNQITAILR